MADTPTPPADTGDRRQGVIVELLALPESEFIDPDTAVNPEEQEEVIGSMTLVERAAYTLAEQAFVQVTHRLDELKLVTGALNDTDRDQLLDEQLLPLYARFRYIIGLMYLLIRERIGWNTQWCIGVRQGFTVVKMPLKETAEDGDTSLFSADADPVVVMFGQGTPPSKAQVLSFLKNNLRRGPGGKITVRPDSPFHIIEEEDEPPDPTRGGPKSNLVN